MGAKSLSDETNTEKVKGAVGALQLLVRHWFVPEDVTPDYYHFTIWRMFQRFVAATVNVFGTQVKGGGRIKAAVLSLWFRNGLLEWFFGLSFCMLGLCLEPRGVGWCTSVIRSTERRGCTSVGWMGLMLPRIPAVGFKSPERQRSVNVPIRQTGEALSRQFA